MRQRILQDQADTRPSLSLSELLVVNKYMDVTNRFILYNMINYKLFGQDITSTALQGKVLKALPWRARRCSSLLPILALIAYFKVEKLSTVIEGKQHSKEEKQVSTITKKNFNHRGSLLLFLLVVLR